MLMVNTIFSAIFSFRLLAEMSFFIPSPCHVVVKKSSTVPSCPTYGVAFSSQHLQH
jgi:hypothetical protein